MAAFFFSKSAYHCLHYAEVLQYKYIAPLKIALWCFVGGNLYGARRTIAPYYLNTSQKFLNSLSLSMSLSFSLSIPVSMSVSVSVSVSVFVSVSMSFSMSVSMSVSVTVSI
jgi:hypothetical protein